MMCGTQVQECMRTVFMTWGNDHARFPMPSSGQQAHAMIQARLVTPQHSCRQRVLSGLLPAPFQAKLLCFAHSPTSRWYSPNAGGRVRMEGLVHGWRAPEADLCHVGGSSSASSAHQQQFFPMRMRPLALNQWQVESLEARPKPAPVAVIGFCSAGLQRGRTLHCEHFDASFMLRACPHHL